MFSNICRRYVKRTERRFIKAVLSFKHCGKNHVYVFLSSKCFIQSGRITLHQCIYLTKKYYTAKHFYFDINAIYLYTQSSKKLICENIVIEGSRDRQMHVLTNNNMRK